MNVFLEQFTREQLLLQLSSFVPLRRCGHGWRFAKKNKLCRSLSNQTQYQPRNIELHTHQALVADFDEHVKDHLLRAPAEELSSAQRCDCWPPATFPLEESAMPSSQ